MFRIGAAFLADAVTVREGLMHVLGGGVTAIYRPSFPASLDVSLGVLLYARGESGTRGTYEIDGFLEDQELESDTKLFEVAGSWEPGLDGEHSISIAVPLGQIGVTHPGAFNLRVVLNEGEATRIPFAVIDSSGMTPDA